MYVHKCTHKQACIQIHVWIKNKITWQRTNFIINWQRTISPHFVIKIDHFRLGIVIYTSKKTHRDDLLPENTLFKHVGICIHCTTNVFRNKNLQSEVKKPCESRSQKQNHK